MKIKFVKDHPSGIGKDSVAEVAAAHGRKLIEDSYAEDAAEDAAVGIKLRTTPAKTEKKAVKKA